MTNRIDQYRRLNKLLDVAHQIDPKKIQMAVWGEQNNCGTTACLMGHAALSPAFQEEGVAMRWEPITGSSKMLWTGHIYLNDETMMEEDRIDFFGLDTNIFYYDDSTENPGENDEHDYLFMPSAYRDEEGRKLVDDALKEEIINHIAKVIERFEEVHSFELAAISG
jgi:hypothetical protein